MNERALYPEIERTARHLGAYWAKNQDLYFTSADGKVTNERQGADAHAPIGGKVDFVWAFGDRPAALVEVKHHPDNFSFAELKPDQRATLDEFERIGWLWLSMGRRLGGTTSPRQAWLIPWKDWTGLESYLRESWQLAGLAHLTPHKLAHRAAGLYAGRFLSTYALDHTDDRWTFPADHAFMKVKC